MKKTYSKVIDLTPRKHSFNKNFLKSILNQNLIQGTCDFHEAIYEDMFSRSDYSINRPPRQILRSPARIEMCFEWHKDGSIIKLDCSLTEKNSEEFNEIKQILIDHFHIRQC